LHETSDGHSAKGTNLEYLPAIQSNRRVRRQENVLMQNKEKRVQNKTKNRAGTMTRQASEEEEICLHRDVTHPRFPSAMSTVSLPADRVVHLRVDNFTSNWSTYTVDFDAAKTGPMVRTCIAPAT